MLAIVTARNGRGDQHKTVSSQCERTGDNNGEGEKSGRFLELANFGSEKEHCKY